MSLKRVEKFSSHQIKLPIYPIVSVKGEYQEEEVYCKPFIKWAGGKRKLLPDLLRRMPRKFNTYFEPFIGGGALFFAVRPKRAILVDINAELVNTYRVVKNGVGGLIRELSRYPHTQEYYYELREKDRSPHFHRWGPVKRAARLIYLNKTCYNGLYRVNADGKFNVPFGRYHQPKIVDKENLCACSGALQSAKIILGRFSAIEGHVRKGDFVYFDPPFVPLNSTSSFTAYTKEGFGDPDQLELRDLCRKLHKKGVFFMLSNSSADSVFELYSEFNIERIAAPRAINSNARKRGKIDETVIRNYR